MIRTKIDDLVTGMAMGAGTLQALIQSIASLGGDPSVLALLARPFFAENLAKIAGAVIDCEWRFPVSDVRQMAEKDFRTTNYIGKADFVGHARHMYWSGALAKLGIPFTRFSSNPPINPDRYYPMIPIVVHEMLNGKTVTYPFTMGNWLVVNCVTDEGVLLKEGDVVDTSKLSSLVLVESKFFDFNK